MKRERGKLVALAVWPKRLGVVFPGLALGLYAGRVLAEILPYHVSVFALLLVTAALVLVGISLATVAHRRGMDLSPLHALYLYIFWPWLSLVLAISVAFVVGVAITCCNMRRAYSLLGDALLFAGSLALYVHTLAPTILPADSGEFQLVASVLGIAHPPGYPLYTMLAKLCTYFPFGDIAYRVNLFSAITSALTLVVLSRVVRRVTSSGLAGWIAAAGLGVAPTFWAQSTTANIRSLTALFTVFQLNILLAYAQDKNTKYLLAFALAFGLGITHHSSIALLALPYVAFILVSDPELVRKPRLLFRPLLIFLLSLSVLLYLPVRSAMGAPFDPQPIRSLSGFLEHVLALGFRGDMFYFVQPTILLSRLRVLLNILALEFAPAWLLLGTWGAVHMLVRRSKFLLLCGGVFIVNALAAITYRAPQTVEYMMPAYVALALICAYGAWSLSEGLRACAGKLTGAGIGVRSLPALVLAAALLLPALMLGRNYPSFAQLSQDRSTRQYAEDVLKRAPQGACILSNWHYATPFWYLQYVEKLRPDIKVVYVYPEGADPMAQVWLRRIAESSTRQPTIVTNYYPEFGAVPYRFQPFAGALLVQTTPIYQVSEDIQRLDALFEDRIRLIGYELDRQAVSPADSLTVRIYWQPAVKLERDYSLFVHLVDETGAVWGQGDVTHQAARYEAGQVILDEHRIPMLPAVRPGRYKLITGVYITLADGRWHRLTTKDGQEAVLLDEIDVQPSGLAPVTLHELYRPFDCGYTLVGVDYDHSLPGQRRVYLHWRCERPLATEQNITLYAKGAMLVVNRLPKMQAGEYCTTAHDLPAEAADLTLELHSVSDEAPSALLGPWKLSAGYRLRLPTPSADERYIPLGGEMLLVRAEYRTIFTTERTENAEMVYMDSVVSAVSAFKHSLFASEQSLRTKLAFVGMRPITNDYTVSVSLTEEANSWRTQHDGTPALGAIPTLKWIRYVTVWDEHDLQLPPGTTGRGVLRLTVYDAFTMRPLPVLDERLARLGQGIQIELGSVEVRLISD